MLPYVAEFVGTAILIILGCSVCAGVSLKKSGMFGGGTVQITFAWAFAVMIPAFIFGAVSGAHFNPALSIALAATGTATVNGVLFTWAMVPGYIIAQVAGAFVGAVIVYILYKDFFDATDDEYTKLRVFCTDASIKNYPLNVFSEVLGTFILVFAILGIGQVTGIAVGLSNVFVWAIIAGIGMSMGGVTGYAINPARDLGPRLAHAVLPIKGKGTSKWSYAWVPIVGPIIGGLLAVGAYWVIFTWVPTL